ncbi:MAG TPA: choice-of-anchor tandem repeat GloVer-containing protein [Verrucomicrobiae bacterium]|nr:choice-of-anchor tandem repeat GloVer-containing protein [Verrucomicrobiae bacterium]
MKILRIPLAIVLLVIVSRALNAGAQTLTALYSFVGGPTDGNNPHSGLVQGSDSNFYGTTYEGGTYGGGAVFQIDSSGNETVLYSFLGRFSSSDGYSPSAGLILGSDGNFYGTTTYGGGSDSDGVVFQVDPSGDESVLYYFGSSPNDGINPSAGLVQGSDSNFYGTTAAGGTYGNGIVFAISPTGNETILYSFGSFPNDGVGPEAGLVQGSDSNFYGTTTGGGIYNLGTVFRISSSGTYTSLYSFAGAPADGAKPLAGLVQGSDGNFYGTTDSGGANEAKYGGQGTVFRITPGGEETVLYSFGSSSKDGLGLMAGLVQGSDSNFYGTTYSGGTNTKCPGGCGTVFRISPSGHYTSLNSFGNYPANGWANPYDGVVQGSDGNFYGTTRFGGTSTNCPNTSCGTVFKLAVGGGGSGGCTYTPSAASVTLPAKGGSKNVSVKANSTACEWTASTTDSWITITSGSSGTGSGKVDYTVPGNTNMSERSGTITIADQTFTVNQEPGGCTVKLSPKAGKLKATGGAATVKVTPNLGDCDWTAVSNDPFITITGGASATGKGTVTYSVPANTNTTTVTGSITIGGETFTVTQAGVK